MSDDAKPDRALRREVLQALRDVYPERVNISELPNADHPAMRASLQYLAEHGLVDVLDTGTFGDPTAIDLPKITAEGLDFLEEDGGISAKLRTVTIKLDPDDLRALLATRVESSDLPPEEKTRLAHAIRSLPVTALQSLTDRFVREAVIQWPDALQRLQTWMGQL